MCMSSLPLVLSGLWHSRHASRSIGRTSLEGDGRGGGGGGQAGGEDKRGAGRRRRHESMESVLRGFGLQAELFETGKRGAGAAGRRPRRPACPRRRAAALATGAGAALRGASMRRDGAEGDPMWRSTVDPDRDIDLDEHVAFLPTGTSAVVFTVKRSSLVSLVTLIGAMRDRVGHADELGDGLAFERTQDLEIRGQDRLRALLDGRERAPRWRPRRPLRWTSFGERGGVIDAPVAGVGFALDDELPGSAAVTLALALSWERATRFWPRRSSARRAKRCPEASSTMKTRIAPLKPSLRLATTLQGSDAVLDERGTFGVVDLQGSRGRLVDDGDRQLILDALVVDHVADADDVVGAAHPADDRSAWPGRAGASAG